MFAKEEFMRNHPNLTLRTIYGSTMQDVWPAFITKSNQWLACFAVCIFGVCVILFTKDRLKHLDECEGQKPCNMLLMGYYYFPFDVNEHYWIANFEDVVFGGMCGVYAVLRDVYFCSYICYLICRLRILSYVVEHLNEFKKEKRNFLDADDDKIDALLKECVREHQDIIRDFQIMKRNTSNIFFLMLLVHGPAVANVTLAIFKGDSTSTFALFVYCAASYGCTHLYLILSLSERISTESVHLAQSIHFLEWYELNIKQQKVLQPMLVRAQRPLVLECGPLFPANLSTFTTTLRAIYTILNAFININK